MSDFVLVGNRYFNVNHIIEINLQSRSGDGSWAIEVITTELIENDNGVAENAKLHYNHGTPEANAIVAYMMDRAAHPQTVEEDNAS